MGIVTTGVSIAELVPEVNFVLTNFSQPEEEPLGHRVAFLIEGVDLVNAAGGPCAIVFHVVVVRIVFALIEVNISVGEDVGRQEFAGGIEHFGQVMTLDAA